MGLALGAQLLACVFVMYVYNRTQEADMQIKYNIYDNPYTDANFLMPFKGNNVNTTDGLDKFIDPKMVEDGQERYGLPCYLNDRCDKVETQFKWASGFE